MGRLLDLQILNGGFYIRLFWGLIALGMKTRHNSDETSIMFTIGLHNLHAYFTLSFEG